MALLRETDSGRVITDAGQIAHELRGAGIHYERWEAAKPLHAEASSQDVLDAYADDVKRLMADGGCTVADVIDLHPDTVGLEEMLGRFRSEHWHDEDEVRLIVDGRGLFHFNSERGRVRALEVERGDFIRVPSGTWHWFDLCDERRIRAIRLFQDPSGWTPHYTGSGADRGFQPLCMGPSYVPATGAPAG
jgi:1,2-dihydroxy-3-keto-5-methylthiopentene dioxygenase